jgi:hypothetical protein
MEEPLVIICVEYTNPLLKTYVLRLIGGLIWLGMLKRLVVCFVTGSKFRYVIRYAPHCC